MRYIHVYIQKKTTKEVNTISLKATTFSQTGHEAKYTCSYIQLFCSTTTV